jgi:hypothetical protein
LQTEAAVSALSLMQNESIESCISTDFVDESGCEIDDGGNIAAFFLEGAIDDDSEDLGNSSSAVEDAPPLESPQDSRYSLNPP